MYFFVYPKKHEKRAQIGHYGRQFDRSIRPFYYCMAKLPFAINGAKFPRFSWLGVTRILNVSSFAYILDQLRNSSTLKTFLLGQQ
ncbi:hypothetical protein COR50_19770 [Chitinophaga caeni]|uniref:Uncharacterized protein n=1 Tax=Chitinophaga caeni TaxID=2029983 RepID=A0A291QZC3_9BACT|nr:hypothetical protein COR50_19770 [Chitinophaga caeni]